MDKRALCDVRLLFEQTLVAESDLIRLKARLSAVTLRMGFSPSLTERTRMVASEIVTNQSKYAGGRGLLQVWEVKIGNDRALDLFALDYGPGIPDLPSALADGYSSSGTLGKGLGGMKRLAHEFGLITRTAVCPEIPWHGTAVWVRFHSDGGCHDSLIGDWDLGLYRRSYQNARDNGDGFVVCAQRGLRVLHLDALGHGPLAAEVIAAASQGFDCVRPLSQALAELELHPRLKRGAAACCYEANNKGEMRWLGVGDMQACLLQGSSRQTLGFSPGILGQVHGRLHESEWAWPVGGLVASASDGIRSDWSRALTLLSGATPQMLAYFIGHVFGRLTDDRSCVIVRRGAGEKK